VYTWVISTSEEIVHVCERDDLRTISAIDSSGKTVWLLLRQIMKKIRRLSMGINPARDDKNYRNAISWESSRMQPEGLYKLQGSRTRLPGIAVPRVSRSPDSRT
jgi:hypothetical protein